MTENAQPNHTDPHLCPDCFACLHGSQTGHAADCLYRPVTLDEIAEVRRVRDALGVRIHSTDAELVRLLRAARARAVTV